MTNRESTDTAAAMRGADVVLEVLRTEGVRHVFGNPGSSEQPLMDALAEQSEIEYVLGLQEATVVATAEGFARSTGRPSFVNLHATAGTGNAIGALWNARSNRTPMVVTAGQQRQSHLLLDPLLAGDIVALARPVCKWAYEVRRPDDIGTILRRAFNDAAAEPPGPVFVSLPIDVLEDTAGPPPARSEIDRRSTAPRLEELADLLTEVDAAKLAIVAGDDVAAGGAVQALVDVADSLGSPVYAASLHGTAVFPQDHPLFVDTFTPTNAGIAKTLAGYDRVLVCGSHPFLIYHFTIDAPVPPVVEVLQISPDASSLGRYAPARLAVLGCLRTSLEALLPLVRARVDRSGARTNDGRLDPERAAFTDAIEAKVLERYERVPADPAAVAHALVRCLPAGTPIVDEAITAGYYVRRYIREWSPHRYYFNRGGGLGWGLPFAVGLSLGQHGVPVVCAIGDGSLMYSNQALWTAARHDLPVIVLVFNNRQYLILKNNLRNASLDGVVNRFVGMDLVDPPIDPISMASSMGVAGSTITSPTEIPDAVHAALRTGGPHVIEVPVGAPA